MRITLFTQDGNTLPVLRALVDTGADFSMFPVTLIDALGISTSECQTVPGHGAAGADAFVYWPNGKIRARVAQWNVELDAWFGNPAIPLLGRSDFFSHFNRISFNEQARTFTIEP